MNKKFYIAFGILFLMFNLTAIIGAITAGIPSVTPMLGNYPNTTVTLGSNTTISPNAPTTGASSINVSTDSNFKGTFVADLLTENVRVTNAHPAGSYLVTVKAVNTGGTTSTTFTLTVNSGTVCTSPVQF
ncbi:MAG: hypothetical protein ABJA66_21135, partial [Actinomycetota bacterium]